MAEKEVETSGDGDEFAIDRYKQGYEDGFKDGRRSVSNPKCTCWKCTGLKSDPYKEND